MIIDTSALVAVRREKPEAQRYALAIESHRIRRMSAANFVEAAVVIDASRNPIASRCSMNRSRKRRFRLSL